MEELGIHAPSPAPEIAEAAPCQILLQARRRHHHPARRRMEAPQRRIADGQRQADPRLHIFGEARVEGGGEGQAAAEAIAPRRHAQRPLRREMNGARLKGIDQPRRGAGAAGPPGESRDRWGRESCVKRSGEMTFVSWPSWLSSSTVRISVRTTPFTCGSQASETMTMRISSWRGQAQHREAAQARPFQDLEPAVGMLHQGRAALDPIAVVAIEDGAELADLGLMDMAADDTVDPAPARLIGQRHLEIVDIADGVLDPALQVGGERPVGDSRTCGARGCTSG